MKVPRDVAVRALSWCDQLEEELNSGKDITHTLEVVRDMFQEWVTDLSVDTARIGISTIRAYCAEILSNDCEVPP